MNNKRGPRGHTPRRSSASDGLTVDASGAPAIDPTENVIALTEAANQRQDDLRELTMQLFDVKTRHIEDMGELRAVHQRQLDAAEATRLDSIRQIDREDVLKTAAQALNAIQTLAATTSATAETLRAQSAAAAAATASQLAVITTEITKRVGAIELALSEGRGKQTVADPLLATLVERMDSLLVSRASVSGRETGISLSWGILVAVVGLFLTVMTLGGIFFSMNNEPTPQYIYTPAPPGSLLPSAPPGTSPPR